jgi:4-diphosphocytidyl-2C-methyl-D-erythritol kinase
LDGLRAQANPDKETSNHHFVVHKKEQCFWENKFRNDFFNVFSEQEKFVYSKIFSQLQKLGAHYANLSGAGSTCFGLFKDCNRAQKAAESLRGKWGFVEFCKPVDYN